MRAFTETDKAHYEMFDACFGHQDRGMTRFGNAFVYRGLDMDGLSWNWNKGEIIAAVDGVKVFHAVDGFVDEENSNMDLFNQHYVPTCNNSVKKAQ